MKPTNISNRLRIQPIAIFVLAFCLLFSNAHAQTQKQALSGVTCSAKEARQVTDYPFSAARYAEALDLREKLDAMLTPKHGLVLQMQEESRRVRLAIQRAQQLDSVSEATSKLAAAQQAQFDARMRVRGARDVRPPSERMGPKPSDFEIQAKEAVDKNIDAAHKYLALRASIYDGPYVELRERIDVIMDELMTQAAGTASDFSPNISSLFRLTKLYVQLGQLCAGTQDEIPWDGPSPDQVPLSPRLMGAGFEKLPVIQRAYFSTRPAQVNARKRLDEITRRMLESQRSALMQLMAKLTKSELDAFRKSLSGSGSGGSVVSQAMSKDPALKEAVSNRYAALHAEQIALASQEAQAREDRRTARARQNLSPLTEDILQATMSGYQTYLGYAPLSENIMSTTPSELKLLGLDPYRTQVEIANLACNKVAKGHQCRYQQTEWLVSGAEFWGGALNDLARRYGAKPQMQQTFIFEWRDNRLVSDSLNVELSDKAAFRQVREARNRKQFQDEADAKERERCEARSQQSFLDREPITVFCH